MTEDLILVDEITGYAHILDQNFLVVMRATNIWKTIFLTFCITSFTGVFSKY